MIIIFMNVNYMKLFIIEDEYLEYSIEHNTYTG